jgi:hypothetical protein
VNTIRLDAGGGGETDRSMEVMNRKISAEVSSSLKTSLVRMSYVERGDTHNLSGLEVAERRNNKEKSKNEVIICSQQHIYCEHCLM